MGETRYVLCQLAASQYHPNLYLIGGSPVPSIFGKRRFPYSLLLYPSMVEINKTMDVNGGLGNSQGVIA